MASNLPLVEDCSDYRRGIGFSTFPVDGQEYLSGLLKAMGGYNANNNPNTHPEGELSRQLDEKNREIAREYAIATGRNPANLSDAERSALEHEVADLIEEAEEALADGDTLEEWRAHDARLAATLFGRLILERHEIEQNLLDELDDQNPHIRAAEEDGCDPETEP